MHCACLVVRPDSVQLSIPRTPVDHQRECSRHHRPSFLRALGMRELYPNSPKCPSPASSHRIQTVRRSCKIRTTGQSVNARSWVKHNPFLWEGSASKAAVKQGQGWTHYYARLRIDEEMSPASTITTSRACAPTDLRITSIHQQPKTEVQVSP